MSKEIDPIQQAVNNLLNAKTQLKKKKTNKSTPDKQTFIKLIDLWRDSFERETFLANEVGADLRNHNDIYYEIINHLCILKFGSEITRIINFYVFEKINPDGTQNQLNDDEGRVVKLDSAEDLWNLIQKINSTLENKK